MLHFLPNRSKCSEFRKYSMNPIAKGGLIDITNPQGPKDYRKRLHGKEISVALILGSAVRSGT